MDHPGVLATMVVSPHGSFHLRSSADLLAHDNTQEVKVLPHSSRFNFGRAFLAGYRFYVVLFPRAECRYARECSSDYFEALSLTILLLK